MLRIYDNPNDPNNPGDYEPPPGLCCPACKGGAFRLTTVPAPALTCSDCEVEVRLLRRHGDPLPLCDPTDSAKAENIEPGSWWIGYVETSDNILTPVVLAETWRKAVNASLYLHVRGTLLFAPTDPPRKANEAA
jgi:hypothetical protein